MLYLDPAIEHHICLPDQLVFTGPTGGFTVIDKAGLFRGVLACLKSGQAVEHAFEAIPDAQARADIMDHVLGLLLARGIIRDHPPETDLSKGTDRLADWLRFSGTDSGVSSPVGVIGKGQIASTLMEQLSYLGFKTVNMQDVEPACDLVVLCQDVEDMARVRAVNRQAIEADIPFLSVHVKRHVISIGPLVVPGATACMECLYHRQRMNALQESETPAPQATSQFVSSLAAMLASAEIARFGLGASYDLHVARLMRHSVLTGKQAHSVVLKLPRCPVCGPVRGERPLVDTFSVFGQAHQTILEPAE